VRSKLIENTILARNRQGKKGLVLGLKFMSTEVIEYAALAGFDAINLDGEHGLFSPEIVDLISRVANGYGMIVTARVPNIDSSTINRWLDRGVQGILGPHIESGEEAQALADACLYPPDGWRSWGGGRGNELGDAQTIKEKHGSQLAMARWANANMIVSAQIESRKGIDNLDDILRVDGIRWLTGGPNDMAASLGHPGEPGHSEVREAYADVARRVRAAGKGLMSDFEVSMRFDVDLMEKFREFLAAHRDDPVTG